MSLVNQMLSSAKAKADRFIKLYRILYRDFLFDDFIHKEDVKRMLKETHERIDTIEYNFNQAIGSAVSELNSNIGSHTHTVATAGSPGAHTGATTATTFVPAKPPVQSAVKPIPWAETRHIQRLKEEIGKGPAKAPYANGTDAIVVANNMEILSDIGV